MMLANYIILQVKICHGIYYIRWFCNALFFISIGSQTTQIMAGSPPPSFPSSALSSTSVIVYEFLFGSLLNLDSIS